MIGFKNITLENGLRVVLAPQPGNLAATVLVLVETGSKYEDKRVNGISHFLEHMCFKGTKKRPKAAMISTELDNLGSSHNAFTSQEYTGYYAKAPAKHFEKILEIVADMYVNPIFDEKEIQKESGVIVEEINMYEDTPRRHIVDMFTELMYGDQPAGWNIAGTPEIVRSLKREDFLKYRDDHYMDSSTVVVVAGSFDEKTVLSKVKEAFKDMRHGEKAGKLKTVESQNEPHLMLKSKNLDQTHIILGVRAYNLFDERRYALEVLSHVLGGGMSSRLFQIVRDELGAAYYINAGSDFYTDHGYLAVSAGVDKNKLEAVLKAVLHEFNGFKSELVGEAELQKAKNHLTGNIVMGLETSDELASYYGLQEVLERRILSIDDLLKKINSVTAREIMDIANEIFKDKSLNLAILGAVTDGDKLRSILKL